MVPYITLIYITLIRHLTSAPVLGPPPQQRKRFHYFQQQRAFVKKLAEICEKLRFLDKEVRGQFLKKDLSELAIPAFAYLPLCRSVDPWRHVLRCLPTECHAFSTKVGGWVWVVG